MKFFILAGGYGKRAQPLSLVKPKPIFPLHGTPLINILLAGLKTAGFKEGFINLHYKPEAIKQVIGNNPGLSIKYLYENELSGSKILVHALRHLEEIDESLFILNGDVFLEPSKIPVEHMFRNVSKNNYDGALLLRKNTNPVYKSVKTENGFFRYTEINKGGESFMYTGVAVFRKRIIEKINHISFFDTLAAHDFKIKTFVYDGTWMDIGDPHLYIGANAGYKRHLNIDLQTNSLSENVTISPGSHVSNCIAWENTAITGRSTLSNCIVTGNMVLRDVAFSNKIIYTTGGKKKVVDFL